MKVLGLTLPILIFMSACLRKENSEFKSINKNIEFKYIQFGDGESAKLGDYIKASLTVCNRNGDTLHFVPDYPYFFELRNSPLDSAWSDMRSGDSAVFLMRRQLFNKQFKFYKPMQSDTGQILLHFRLKEVIDKDKIDFVRKRVLSKREVQEQAGLKRFLTEFNGELDTLGGIYRIVQQRNAKGDTIVNGSEVSIEYRGSFLNGYQFEDTREKGLTPTFVYGREYQLIEGMHLGLRGLKSGERVKIILPSRRAFGKEGSLAGIVPPYTAVIFDVNIKKVRTKK